MGSGPGHAGWCVTTPRNSCQCVRLRRAWSGQIARDVLAAINDSDTHHAWIYRVPAESLLAQAAALEALPKETRVSMPLYGVPFAVKDNIDVAGLPTTAACPAFAHVPSVSATVVQRLQVRSSCLWSRVTARHDLMHPC